MKLLIFTLVLKALAADHENIPFEIKDSHYEYRENQPFNWFVIQEPIYTNIYDHFQNYTEQESVVCGRRGGYYFDRIVGGHATMEGEFPWQVSIQLKTGLALRHICGGAVIDRNWVLTAAHCVSDINPSALYVVAGDHNLYVPEGKEQRRGVLKIITNNFDLPTFSNDIALLKLDAPFQFFEGSNVSPICLPESYEKFEGLATITGWGRLGETSESPSLLQQVSIPLMNKVECGEAYRKMGYSRYLNICQLCASQSGGGKDACQGDSGGPLVCRKDDFYYLCGIVSWGIGCGRPNFPGVYTEVSCFVDWIKHIISSV